MIALMMEALSTPETSVNFDQTTRRNIPEDSHLHTRHCENLKNLTWMKTHQMLVYSDCVKLLGENIKNKEHRNSIRRQ
jgi:hypothetical protein